MVLVRQPFVDDPHQAGPPYCGTSGVRGNRGRGCRRDPGSVAAGAGPGVWRRLRCSGGIETATHRPVEELRRARGF